MTRISALHRAATILASAVALTGAGIVVAPSAPAATALTGTFTITAGSCSNGVHGSYFRMILHGGNANGPFLSNSDSTCSKKTYSLLAPGTDGGLTTGRYQRQAKPAFDGSGNALTSLITKPTRFYGVNFATATNSVDPQTGKHVSPPRITVTGSSLSGDLRGFAVSWNRQQFNQGSPKPNGSRPGNTRPVTGTYDAATGAYTLQWMSQIQGGPFDGFTGLWHLTGKFKPARAVAAVASAPATARSSAVPAADTTPKASPTTHSPTASAVAVPTSMRRSSSPAAAAVIPSLAPPSNASGGGTGSATPAAESGRRLSGDTRWPWLLGAFAAIAAVAAVATRQLRPRRIA